MAYQFEASEDEGVMEERAASFSIYHGFVLCSCVLEKMSCLSSCKKIALAYSPCQTRRIIKWLAIGLSQSSYRFYSMLATFALKDYRLVATNRAKSLELSFYTVDDAMLVELQSKLGFGNSGCCLRNLMFSFDNFKIMSVNLVKVKQLEQLRWLSSRVGYVKSMKPLLCMV
ncbi:hypothetical protein POTOM_021394 [Populus tomentosa]|uniref:Uncharacterized protein n=1 Tax=Populus tomentosa TaxID=118781 RepID=A0A8X7ZRT5_POPTO|nr:hypothetical protein POTOM_021394 [Populus tomentosa]